MNTPEHPSTPHWGQPGHPPQPAPETAGAPAGEPRRAVVPLVAGGLVIALVSGLFGWALGARSAEAELAKARGEVAEVRAELAEVRAELAEVREQLAAGGGASDPLSGLLEGLLGGGDGGGGLGDLFGGGDLDGLFGEGGLDGLFGEGGLDGLFGGDGGDLSGLLEGLTGGGDLGFDAGVISCLSTTPPDAPSGPLASSNAADQVEEIRHRVAALRELPAGDPIDTELVTRAEFTQIVRDLVDEDLDLDELDADERYLVQLGAVPADIDLAQTIVDLVGDQAAGFYEPERDRIVVATDDPDEPLSPAIQVIVAHEFDHALAHHALGLPTMDPSGDADTDTARLSLVEGDATVLMQQYALTSLSLTEQIGMTMDPSVVASQAQLETVPHYLTESLLFPYMEGLNFVCSLHSDGGWAAVDDAYADPPTATVQILDPARYASGDVGRSVAPPASPGSGWDEVRSMTFGAAELMWLLDAPGGDTTVAIPGGKEFARNWDGGTSVTFARGGESAVGIGVAERPGSDLCEPLIAWAEASWPARTASSDADGTAVGGSDGWTVVRCLDGEVRIGTGPDERTARGLASPGGA